MIDFLAKFKTQIRDYLTKLPPLSNEYKKLISEYLYYITIIFCIYIVYSLIFATRLQFFNNWLLNFIDFTTMIIVLIILTKSLVKLKEKRQQGLDSLVNAGIILTLKESIIAFILLDFIGIITPVIVFSVFYYLIIQIEEFYY
ncbi:MAG: hypothetical protein KatS3mg091_337 [Patescibacteria group bacterium]|nr:MAG: hypothetical protein KatS3mg091_337 [Patescibacteria group bacterium]